MQAGASPDHTVTRLIDRALTGDPQAAGELLPIVYGELRAIAQHKMLAERPGHTLQATALVHEAYLRLVGREEHDPRPWQSRAHFFAAAAEAMRRILVDQARRRNAVKRGGDLCRLDLEDGNVAIEIETAADDVDLIALDAALAALEAEDERKAILVKLRHFAGLTGDQAAAALGISPATADRHWAYAKAFLYAEISRHAGS